MGRYMRDAQLCYWNEERMTAGGICSTFYPQLPGDWEGNRGYCPEMEAWADRSDGEWIVTGLGVEIRGNRGLPAPGAALGLLREKKRT